MQTNSKCFNHNQDIVAFDLSQTDQKLQGLCPQCLGTGRNNVIFAQDAQEMVSQIKTELKQKKDEQNQKNIHTLRDLQSNVMELKKFYDTSINKLTGNIDQWIACLEKALRNDIQISQTNDISLLNQKQLIHSDHDFQGLLNVIRKQLNNITQNLQINKCIQILSSLDLDPIIVNSGIEEARNISKTKRNPKLSFLCEKHDLDIVLLNLNQYTVRENRIACIECVEENTAKYTSVPNFQIKWNQFIIEKENTLSSFQKKYSEQMEYYKSTLQRFRDNQNNIIYEAINQLNDQNSQVELNVQSILKPLRKNWQKITKEEVIDIAEQLSQQNDDSTKNLEQDQLILQEQIFKIIGGTQSQLGELQQQFLSELDQKIKIALRQAQKNKSLKQQIFKINYELQQNSLLQNEKCTAIAISTEQNIVVAGCNQKIRVFEFKAGRLNQKQQLEYSSFVKTIYIMKNSKQFVTGSQDYSISIWSINNKNQYNQCKVLKNVHQKSVNCIIMFSSEDQMISCSEDQTIKFWKNQNDWDCFQTLTEHNQEVYSLSLNPTENQLVSCGADGKIIITQKVGDFKWEMLKATQVESYGLRINFINDNLIVFQPAEKDVLEIYDWNKENKELKKINEVQGLVGKCPTFIQPIVYVPQRSIIASKQGSNIYLIRKDNNQFILDQAIRFDDDCIKFDLSEDGNYLISWDGKSKLFQVRLLK